MLVKDDVHELINSIMMVIWSQKHFYLKIVTLAVKTNYFRSRAGIAIPTWLNFVKMRLLNQQGAIAVQMKTKRASWKAFKIVSNLQKLHDIFNSKWEVEKINSSSTQALDLICIQFCLKHLTQKSQAIFINALQRDQL